MPLLCLLLAQAVGPTGELRARITLKTGEGMGRAELWTSAPGTSRASVPVWDSRVPILKKLGPASWDEKDGLTIRIPDVPPGPRLFIAAWRTDGAAHYLDARWVDVKPLAPGETVAELALTLEPSVAGAVEITPAEGVARAGVAFLSADADGRIPAWSERQEGPAFTEPLKGGKAVFKGMKPGRYVFYPVNEHPDRPAPTVTVGVEVKPGATTRATLD